MWFTFMLCCIVLFNTYTSEAHRYAHMLCITKQREDGSLYDFYRGRVIFPIRDVTGRFIGFGGRTLKKDKKAPKYVNSPESPLYDKSRALYGIHLARNAISREDRAILVEGYTDVMAMRQAGVEHVVASSGTWKRFCTAQSNRVFIEATLRSINFGAAAR